MTRIFDASEHGLIIQRTSQVGDVIGACFGADGLLLREGDVGPDFFRLESGLAGELLQKLVNYGIRTAFVCATPDVYGQRFAELAVEHASHPQVRFVRTAAEARQWLDPSGDSRVTIHMVASLDGFIARRDGAVDWLETSDVYPEGFTMTPEFIAAFLRSIDCYVLGSRTYETALNFEAQGAGWAYGDTPTFVLTTRELPRTRESVKFWSGDLAELFDTRLRPRFKRIWVAGGGAVAGECLRLDLVDEVSYSIVPVAIGDGVPFFGALDRDVTLHLAEVKAYKNGMVNLRYEVTSRRERAV
jgi:dihydrofolate reductase